MAAKGPVLVQFAGTERNAPARKSRPGLELAVRGVDGQHFARVVILHRAGAPQESDVAEALAADIRRAEKAPHVTVEPIHGTGWRDHASRSEAAGPIAEVAKRLIRFDSTEGGFYLSTLSGHPAQWTLLAENLVRRADLRLIAPSPNGKVHVIHVPRAAGAVEDQVERLKELPPGIPVLLLGETGAGKSRAARMLHSNWGGSESNFEQINCAAMPSTLLESLLFGAEKGAYTGAVRPVPGAFEKASGGTLFLDEIGELGLELQAKLLTALDPHRQGGHVRWRITRLGADKHKEIDARVVLGTNRDLPTAAAGGRFRVDLLGRIAFRTIVFPPLRSQRHAIPGAYLDRLRDEDETYTVDKRKPLRFAFHRDAFRDLVDFAFSPESTWPWNYRDVEHSVRRLAFAAWTDQRETTGDTIFIEERHMTPELAHLRTAWRSLAGPPTPEAAPGGSLSEAEARAVEGLPLIERYEGTWLLRALKETGDNRAAAWRWLVARRVYAPEGEPNPSAAFGVRWKRVFPK